ncbi:sulfotransferase domain-containing protein [uncultured Psychroserpens sp.]|uniref:sulfotransferase domain-containing protein n=1 Tax=uncultured Psychroserpens sp. TaxID=255436 RepID=UPI0026284657|nr:sulfotransferase domain-containing protein [uncultured Psychroserpens sp.]
MRYAFVTGMGRSGTKFLGSLLALDINAFSAHEYIGNREYWLVSWYLGKVYSTVILSNAKKKIDAQITKDVFIDVNGYLSDSVESLNDVFENPAIFHLVRNPKKVVPSLMIRRDDRGIHKIPKNQKDIEAWTVMSKLEQVCVNWVQTTEDLLKSDAQLLLFENIIKDYDYLSKHVLTPLGLTISKKQYDEFKSKKVNKTRGWLYRYLYAKYKGKRQISKTITFEDLTEEQRSLFFTICGPTMDKLGYK